jgi:virginiamycin B lyase
MQRRMRAGYVAAVLLLAAAGCGGGGGGSASGGSSVVAPVTPALHTTTTGNGSVALTIPNRSTTTAERKRRALYVSPASSSLTVAVNSGTPTVADVSAGSTLCTPVSGGRSCTIPVNAPPGTDSFVLDMYDAANGTGNLLATGTGTTTVTAGQPFTLAITLQGVSLSVALIPDAGSTLTPAGTNAYSLAKCFPSQNVDVTGVDADGNAIVGPGAPAPTLVSSDPTQLAVTAPAASTPNTFVLTRPAIPQPNGSITLTASIAPVAGGGNVASLPVAITFPASTAICGVFTEYPLSSSTLVYGMTTGSDGAIWFTEYNAGKIGRITTSGAITEERIESGSLPYGIAAGKDGQLWFTESGLGKIGRINPTTLVYNACETASWGSTPTTIVAGPDTALWYDEPGAGKIGRITLGNTASDYPVPGGATAAGMVADPSGARALWFSVPSANAFYRISANTSNGTLGAVSGPYALTDTSPANIQGMTAGPDNNIWFTEYNLQQIGKIDPVSHLITEYPTTTTGGGPVAITTGPDGTLWFTATPNIANATTAGTVAAGFATPSGGNAPPYPITTGPDGSLWYADNTAHKIGRLQ